MIPRRTALWLMAMGALSSYAGEIAYRAVSVDKSGQLHVTLNDGREVLAPKMDDQVAFDSPLIAADHGTVGWLVGYADPSSSPGYAGSPLAGALVLYRNGRVLHKFDADQVFWDWHFEDDGKRVAYSTGPTHGGASECVLADSTSGKVVARWQVRPGGKPPKWAASLRG